MDTTLLKSLERLRAMLVSTGEVRMTNMATSETRKTLHTRQA